MKKIVGLSLALSAGLLLNNVAFSADKASTGTKVCVVEIAKVLRDSPQVKKDVEKLKSQFAKDQNAIETKQAALEKQMKDYKKNESDMSDADKAKTEKNLAEQRQSLMAEVTTFQQKLTAAQKATMDVVFKKLNNVIQSNAKTLGCEVVLDSQFVLWAQSQQDITAQVEKAFDSE